MIFINFINLLLDKKIKCFSRFRKSFPNSDGTNTHLCAIYSEVDKLFSKNLRTLAYVY